MVRKKLIQKLQQLIDNLPIGIKRKEVNYDLSTDLKLVIVITTMYY